MFALGRRDNTSQRFEFGLQNATNAYIGVGDSKKITTAHGMVVDTWYNWITTFAGGSNGALKVYRDGAEIIDSTTSWTDTAGSNPIYFGCRNAGGYNNGWTCGLEEIAIFNKVKSVSTLWDGSGKPVNQTGADDLVGYWKLNEGSGIITKDTSGNGNHGTLTTNDAELPTWSTDTP